jgi:hypothetical protein
MPSSYTVTEPHPHTGKYVLSGRGGAGNTFKAPQASKRTSTSQTASLFDSGLPSTASKFSSGRGGAGNIHNASEKPFFSFDEELERQTTREQRIQNGAVWHVGRGGAGNTISSQAGSSRKDSSSSIDSNGSERSGLFSRLSHSFDRR